MDPLLVGRREYRFQENKNWAVIIHIARLAAAVLVSAADEATPAGFWAHCNIVILTYLLTFGEFSLIRSVRIYRASCLRCPARLQQ